MLGLLSMRSFAADQRGSVSIVGALMLPVLLGMSGLALEFGGSLLAKAETQRVADLAAGAGAIAYARSQNSSEMTLAAQSIAILNGVAREQIGVTLEASPISPGAQAVRATITVRHPLVLARVLNAQQYLDVKVDALAATVEAEPACIQALDPAGSGVTLSGGTAVVANDCVVASNATVTAPCGTAIWAVAVNYNSAAAPTQCHNILTSLLAPAPLVKTVTPDPLAGLDAISTAAARVTAVTAMTAPVVAAGGNILFGWDLLATKAQAVAVGCVATFFLSTWTVTCPGKTTVNMGSITIAGGLTLNFAVGAPITTIYNFSGRIENSGGSIMKFGPGVYNVAQGIIAAGGVRTEFTGGSFRVGPATGGNAITVGGGATLIMGSTTVTGGVFQIVGNVVTDGGSCVVVGAALNHDILGAIKASGAMVFGAGVYTIDGYLHLGAAAGGSVLCNGALLVSMQAIDTTFVLSGRGVPTGSVACANQAFCASAGYSNMKLVAPTSGPFAKLAMIGPLNPSVHSGASFQAGALGSQISGAFYFPNGPLSMSGGASAGGGSGCLQLIASKVTLSGGSTAASTCFAPAAGTTSSVRLLE